MIVTCIRLRNAFIDDIPISCDELLALHNGILSVEQDVNQLPTYTDYHNREGIGCVVMFSKMFHDDSSYLNLLIYDLRDTYSTMVSVK